MKAAPIPVAVPVAVLVAALTVALPRQAAADGHKLLVLQSEGRADPALRARVDAAITRLATTAEPQASAGELTLSDAATAVGCKPGAPGCNDEILGMLAVDEIVITTVNPGPAGLEIAVRRVSKDGSRDQTIVVPAGAAPDRLDGLAPLFGDRAAGAAPEPASPAGAGPPGVPPPTAAAPPAPSVAETPADRPGPPPVELPSSGHHRLEIAGMAGGAALATLGLVFWSAANGVQGDIDSAPVRTGSDLAQLRDLESKGDAYATAGNVLLVAGVVVAGVATVFYIRDRRAGSSASARLVPTVFDHGAGVALTFGGRP
jgi:hypothetical protein